MNEAATTIPPGLVGKIAKNRSLPEPILILEFGKYRPLANWEKSISIYLANFFFFFLLLVKYAESQVHRCKKENIYFKASLFFSLVSSILKLTASKKCHFPQHTPANYYCEKGSKTFEGNSPQMYHLLRQTLSFRNLFNEDPGHTLPAREGIASSRLSDNGGKRKSKRYAKS